MNTSMLSPKTRQVLAEVQSTFTDFFSGLMCLGEAHKVVDEAKEVQFELRHGAIIRAFTDVYGVEKLEETRYKYDYLHLDLLAHTLDELIALWRSYEFILECGGVSLNDVARQTTITRVLLARDVNLEEQEAIAPCPDY